MKSVRLTRLRYFKKMEKYSVHEDNPNVDLKQRGTFGPVQVGYFSGISDFSKAFIRAAQNLGVPFSPDFNVVEGQAGVNRVSTSRSDTAVNTTDSVWVY